MNECIINSNLSGEYHVKCQLCALLIYDRKHFKLLVRIQICKFFSNLCNIFTILHNGFQTRFYPKRLVITCQKIVRMRPGTIFITWKKFDSQDYCTPPTETSICHSEPDLGETLRTPTKTPQVERPKPTDNHRIHTHSQGNPIAPRPREHPFQHGPYD